MKYEEKKLSELVDTISDTRKIDKDKVVLVNTSDVLAGEVLNHTYTENCNLRGQFKKRFKTDDILYSEIRPANKRFAYIDFDSEDYIASTKLMVLRRKSDKITNKYLYYCLTNDLFVDRMQHLAEARSGTFPQITFDVLKGETIYLPSIANQNKITSILDNINNKIRLNNEINNNLYEFSNSIFKKWFIQFEYPDFNGNLKESELGKMPEDWEIGYFDDSKLTSIIKSGVDKFEGTKKYVATADVTEKNITNYEEVSYNEKPSRANMTPRISSVWFAKMENSVKNILVDSYMKDILNNYIFSTGFMGVECINNSLYYIWNIINDDKFLQEKNSLSTGTLMAGISNSTIKNYKYLIPDQNTLHKFNEIQLNINKKIYNNSIQNEKLSQLRDTLLPKLMNGEIDLDNIEV